MKKRSKLNNKYKIREQKWNERFILEKIPQYDAYKDINYLSLGLVKSKLRYEEKQLKESQKKNKKLRTNSSRHTLNTKPKKNKYTPLFTAIKENEKNDLFTLKLNKRPLTIKRKKQNNNKLEFNIKEKKEENNNYLKTYENNNIYNNIQTNINENKEKDKDKEFIVIDKALEDELNEIKDLWDNLGVTPEYQIFFGEMMDKLKKRDIIVKYLSYEKKQLIQFKSDLEKLMNDIYKRETDLNNLKKIEEIYSKNEQLNQYNYLKNKQLINKIKNIKYNNDNSLGQSEDEISQYKMRNKNENEYDKDNIEKSKEYDEEYTKYKINKEKIENDICNCLKLLRLHTINTVSQFTKFRINYNFYFTSGKNDVNQMKNGYEFDYNYLLKIKKDCEFFKKSSFKNIFNFSDDCQNDPFFLNLLNNNNNGEKDINNKSQYKYLNATEDTINSINECMFILDQEDMYFKISQNQNQINNNNNEKNDNNESSNDNVNENNNNGNSNSNKKVKKNSIGSIGNNFQGNLENVISKLKEKNEYKNLFFNSGEFKEPLIKNENLNENINIKNECGPKKIPETSSKELVQSFQYYDQIKNDIYNKEEIEEMKNNINRRNNNKIVIYSKINNNNANKDKFSKKINNSLNLNFNNIYKNNNNQNENNNSLKINFNCITNKYKNNEQLKKKNELSIKLNNKNDSNNKIEENRKQDNNNINDNNIDKIIDNKNININNNKAEDNNIINKSNISCEEEIIEEKNINCKYVSILSLTDKKNLPIENNNFNIGNHLFKFMNPFNLNLLINSLKNNNKYTISNSTNSIIISSPEEIKSNYNYINKQNNNIINVNELEKILKEKNIYLYENNDILSIKYAFLSSIININFNSIISSSIIYNKYNYIGIKINSSKNIISIEEDITIYTIPTNDENILIYICPYNDKIKEIIKKYDKNNNIFNGFSSFVNIISLYFEDNDNNNNDGNEKNIWLPCFEINTQLICNKIPGYKTINIKDNNDKKDMAIFEYDEIIKINMKTNLNNENDNININQKEEVIIENDFIFGIFHKEMNNKYNCPFLCLSYIRKDNFIEEK